MNSVYLQIVMLMLFLLVTACASPATLADQDETAALPTTLLATPTATTSPINIPLPPDGKLYHGVYPGGVTWRRERPHPRRPAPL
jgi:hypothetical protein